MSPPPRRDATPEAMSAHQLDRSAMPVLSPIRPVMTPLQMAGLDPMPQTLVNPMHCVTSYQFKNVHIYSGKDKQGPRIEDWVRDMRHLLHLKGSATHEVMFNEIVRHTSGRARDLVLNLERRNYCIPAPEVIFSELLEEYGESHLTVSPMAAFYARMQYPNETPSEYAIALEALLWRALTGEDRTDKTQPDKIICTQFMCGLRDRAVKDRLAPMRPRDMPFKELRRELHVIAEETRQTQVGLLRHDVKPESKEEPDRMQDFLESMRCQLAQIQHTQQQQLETIHRLVDGHGQLGNRLGELEGFVTGPSMPARGKQPSSQDARREPPTCYTCGQIGHISTRCPTRSNSFHANGLNM